MSSSGSAAQLTSTNGPAAPMAELMDLPGDELLPRAVLAGDEHAAVGRRRHGNLLAELAHGTALAHHRVPAIDAGPQRAILGLEPPLPQRVAHRQDGLLERQGFLDEVEGPELRGLHGRLDVRVAGDHDDLRVHMPIAQPLERHQPIDAGQPDIEQHDLIRPPANLIETRLAAVHGVHRVPFVAEHAAKRRPHARLIVDDQNRGHGPLLTVGFSPTPATLPAAQS